MDRDPRENIIDPVERVSPTSGDNDTGEADDEQARIHRKRQQQESERSTDEESKTPGGQT